MGSLLVECQEALKDSVISEVAGPAVCDRDGGVKFRVAGGKPGGALVVELGQGAHLEAGGTFGVAWHKARIARGARRKQE